MTDTSLIVCVLGMHRSGSSLAAQILAANGVRTGRSQIGRSRHNREGHLEDRFVVRTNKQLLLHFGGSWDRPPHLPERWTRDERVAELLRRAIRYRHREAAPRAPFFFKDPRTSLLIPFWREVFGPRLRYLVVLRNPDAVVASLLRRQQAWLAPERFWWRTARSVLHRLHGALEPLRALEARQARELWDLYYSSIVRDLAGQKPTVVVHERLLNDPEGEIRRVFAELELPRPDFTTGVVKAALSHSVDSDGAPEVLALERRLRGSVDLPRFRGQLRV